ncbi:alpha beta-hydrolase [Abortiporus biennis]|nr:alpha beta-hydrolase [Abortiporus biennis]
MSKNQVDENTAAAQRTDKIYKELSSLPIYTSAQFLSQDFLRVKTAVNDNDRKLKIHGSRTYVLHEEIITSSFTPETSEVVASVTSPSGERTAIFREVADSTAKDGKKRYVEIWSNDSLLAQAEVSKIHGAFYTDEILSLVSFSPSEDALVYCAENNADDKDSSDSFAKYRFTPVLGEGYRNRKRSRIYHFRWNSQQQSQHVVVLNTASTAEIPLITQPIFAGDSTVYAVGYAYSLEHRLLGVKYCPNRLATIVVYNLPTKRDQFPEEGELMCTGGPKDLKPPANDGNSLSYRCPRIIYNAKGQPETLIWIANAVGGPHASCSTLHSMTLRGGEQKVVVDIVDDPKDDEFPGLYTTTLPVQPFLQVGQHRYLVANSNWRSRGVVVITSLRNGTVRKLTPDNDTDINYSWNVLATDGGDQVVCSRSAPMKPHELVLGRLDASGQVSWRVLAQPSLSDEVKKGLDGLISTIILIDGRYPTETIVIRSKQAAVGRKACALPCITSPHGGPHGANTTAFNASLATFALDGYAVSLPNYTGSVGFGNKYVKKLLGAIGQLDVDDCMASVQQLVEMKIATTGPGKQFITGGSHGGFLTGHLIGQFPHFFSAAILRNPVIALGEISTSDIPDWYYEESGIAFKPETILTPEIFKTLYQMSPIAYVDNVQIPVLLLLGEIDERVSPTQAKGYYHALKARGQDVEMLCFSEDGHPLESVEAQLISFQSSRDLFSKWVKRN